MFYPLNPIEEKKKLTQRTGAALENSEQWDMKRLAGISFPLCLFIFCTSL